MGSNESQEVRQTADQLAHQQAGGGDGRPVNYSGLKRAFENPDEAVDAASTSVQPKPVKRSKLKSISKKSKLKSILTSTAFSEEENVILNRIRSMFQGDDVSPCHKQFAIRFDQQLNVLPMGVRKLVIARLDSGSQLCADTSGREEFMEEFEDWVQFARDKIRQSQDFHNRQCVHFLSVVPIWNLHYLVDENSLPQKKRIVEFTW
jgi:hypothetical protein